ncbi:putative F-box/LRR-repeat protein 23 [Corylus avellana]|uniref:putative F-box/LRR-repeat protein 23 n=1 Tax=Corylus avellana TaxID=13451 RepID=UPI001E1F77C2|nr:putative F-box/LRR-repeat protein 23 [Corylus avellana]
MDTPPDLDEFRNWLELPRDVTASILLRLEAIEILTSAQMVCSPWRKLCKDPSMWRTVHMCKPHSHWDISDLEKMCRQAVDRSCGQLVDICIKYFGDDELLMHIADSSSQLKRLRLVSVYDISDEGLSEVAAKLPLLEELDITLCCSLSKEALKAMGRCCPHLKSFKYNEKGYRTPYMECNEVALAIAENMPELRHLQLFGNTLTNDGLQAILDGCPHLESLDLRQCLNVILAGDLGKRCAGQIKHLRRPLDSTDDYEFDAELDDDYGSFDGDYPSGLSDYDLHLSDPCGYYDFSDSEDYDDFTNYKGFFDGDFY